MESKMLISWEENFTHGKYTFTHGTPSSHILTKNKAYMYMCFCTKYIASTSTWETFLLGGQSLEFFETVTNVTYSFSSTALTNDILL